jgi:hypothetical protein
MLLASLAPLLCVGCGHKTVQAAAPTLTPPAPDVRPMTVAPDTDATPPVEASATAPAMPAPSAKAPVDLADSTVVPPPRRPAAAQPPAEEAAEQDTTRAEPLRISPQLSPSDQATYQRQFEDDSAVATKNLQTVTGRQLNATQQDLFDKIRDFLSKATDAGKESDWIRAETLAHRARVLSADLIQSL